MTISLLKWVDALVLLSAIYIAFPGQRDNTLIILTTYYSFDEVSQNAKLNWLLLYFIVRVVLVEANRTRSRLDLSKSRFALWNLIDLARICMKEPDTIPYH